VRFLAPKFVAGICCLAVIGVLAAAGIWVSGFSPDAQSLMDSLQPPFDGGAHLLGTDQLGRDILARMASGARVSLLIAATVVLVSGAVGVLLGAVSGTVAGWLDAGLQRVVETVWAFPPILLAIVVMAVFGHTLENLILALTVQRWIPYCRMARAEALSLRGRDFVAASRLMGAGTGWILRRHILPNLLAGAVVIGSFSMATAIIAEASLSFLGLGVPPGIATWGGMLAESRAYITRAWWLAVLPGMGIFLTVLGLNLLGDWLRDQMDPDDEMNLV
jgi:peptide/nickel transport system permease protein